MQMAPSMDILGTQTAQKKDIFWPFLTDFETYRHLQHPFPAATVECPAQTWCDCPSHP